MRSMLCLIVGIWNVLSLLDNSAEVNMQNKVSAVL